VIRVDLPLLLLFLLLTFTTSVLLTKSLLPTARRTVAGIGLLVFWLCTLIVPVQCLALLEMLGLTSFLRVSQLLAWSGLALACALALYARMRLRPGIEQAESGSLRGRGLPLHMAIGLVIVLGVYGILAARMAFGAPEDWDAVAYHYPVALRWLQDGTMRITGATSWRASLPANVGILDLLVLSTGHERWLQIVQWPGVLILWLATWRLGRKLGGSAAAAWPVATTVLMFPMLARQSASGYVDLFGTALMFGGLTLVLEYCEELENRGRAARRGLLLAAGLGCGLAVGAKPVFYFCAIALTANTAFLLFRHERQRQCVWPSLAVFLAGAAIPSFFWFARATLCTGNPFFPFSLHLGSVVLPGVRASEITSQDFYLENVRHWAELFVHPWTEWKRHTGHLLTNYTIDNGLGGGFATFAAPGVLFAAWLARRQRPELRIWLLNLGFLGLSWWFLLHKVVRFGLPMFVLAVVISAPFFEVLERGATRLYRFLYVSAFAVTAAMIAFAPLQSMAQRWLHSEWGRAEYSGYPRVIDRLPPGSRILSLCEETFNFALAGSSLTNRVIPSWERPPVLTAGFLRSHHVDFVVEKATRERGDEASESAPPIEGLDIYFRESLPAGENTVVEWRVWSARRLRNVSP